MKHKIDIIFYISEENQSKDKEKLITSWFKTFYLFYIEIEKKKMKANITHAAIYLFISVALLTASFFGVLNRKSIVEYTLPEIIIVGGWVFLWESISKIFFQQQSIRKLIRNYKRFAQSEIGFRYGAPMA
jgi:hypothetical protein